MKMIFAAMRKGEAGMIRLHDADDGHEIWLNEIYIDEITADEKVTIVSMLARECCCVTETPEQILGKMGETTQPAPAKNNLTKWIIGMSDEALENVISAGTQRHTCLACPAKDLCEEMDGSCAGAFRRWAMEASEESYKRRVKKNECDA